MLTMGGNTIPVGNIVVKNLQTEQGEDGLTHFAFNDTINIEAGDLEGIDMWYGPMIGDVPLDLKGKLNDSKLFVTIDIDMQSSLGQIIYVQVGTDDFTDESEEPVREGTLYTEPIVVTINEESSEPQPSEVIVYANEDGTIDFELKNFVLTLGGNTIPVGNIVVKNLQTEQGEDGLTHFAFNDTINIESGDLEGIDFWIGPQIGDVPLDLHGKLNDSKLFVTIDIDMSETSLKQIIYVQVGTDDFTDEPETVPGDVNGDNVVNVADAQFILNLMADESYEALADVNSDGAVNVADYQFILNIMAEQ